MSQSDRFFTSVSEADARQEFSYLLILLVCEFAQYLAVVRLNHRNP
jgi:hypothetical protein